MASGGLDSTVLLYKLMQEDKDVQLIYVNYGQHFIDTELKALRSVVPQDIYAKIKVIDISSAYTNSQSPLIRERDVWKDEIHDSDLYIPYRSLAMLSVSMAYAQTVSCSILYAAFIDSNYVKEIDCSSEFFEKLDSVNDLYSAVTLNFPFRNMTKREVWELGLQIHAPITRTFSCQITKEIPCGVCPNCVDRNNAIHEWEATEYH